MSDSEKTLNKSYALAALLIHACNKEVTKESIVKIFTALKLECSPKIASMFALSAQDYVDMLKCGRSGPAQAVTGGVATKKAEEAAPAKEEESEESDNVLDLF